ncbi:RNA-dependent RNA polymerase eukaryotic-type [Neofusicoccum parvum]|nr:RNA-dependent RNA polymerase eukaryotic-type [Neofusicoccum parvum]
MAPPGRASPRPRPILNNQEWKTWQDVKVIIMGIPGNTTTLTIYKLLKEEGDIFKIELSRDREGRPMALVTFSSPPKRAFWAERLFLPGPTPGSTIRLTIALATRQYPKHRTCPANQSRSYPGTMTVSACSIDFGFMYSASAMMVMEKAPSTIPHDVKLTLNLSRENLEELDIRFPLNMWNEEMHFSVLQQFRFQLPISRLKEIYEERIGDKRVLIIPIEGPPHYLRKVQDGDSTHNAEDRVWMDWKMWYRQTDITHLRSPLRTAPTALRKMNPVIDIGRWTTFRLEFGPSKTDFAKYDTICRALTDWNISIIQDRPIAVLEKEQPILWDIIDTPRHPSPRANASPSGLLNRPILLDFDVRYQLEVCLSNNILNEHNITREFVQRLADMDKTRARSILEVAMDKKRRFYEPMDIFKLQLGKKAMPKDIPTHCVYSRAANVTPTTIMLASPSIEISNRVVRDHIQFSDRFLRVKFTEEKPGGKLNSREGDSENEVFTRVWRTLRNGITIGDRHYEFLAFGNSQFREHGAYFFAPVEGQSDEANNRATSDIREWMGDFSEIHEVARYASRMGQCFSTTRAVTSVKAQISGHEDIKRNGYTFTDGVGRISPLLARQAAEEFGHPNFVEDTPSVFQFRLGGCKGVLAVSPELSGLEIHVRRSQDKFPAPNDGLEIIKWSQFATATLNRQLIIVLDSLGVPEQVFMNKLRNQLSDLTKAMTSEEVALRLLQRYVDVNQVTMTMAGMVLDGFMAVKEPFMISILKLWMAWSIKSLKEKAKLFIGDGAFLLGCVDETASLHGHFYAEQDQFHPSRKDLKLQILPEIFVQIPDPDHEGRYKIIEGLCIVARNPSLHPGDIRVVRAVDKPQLHHLKNAVVFPQTGDRDIPNMCSGGDLDGDDYLVVWDKELIPELVNYPPMDFTSPGKKFVDEVMMEDIARFFVEYIKNDSLGRIANAHLASADFADEGVMSKNCLALAELHSTAVDYPKSGVAAKMSSDMPPKQYPHFMQNKNRRSYVSAKILGRLYDAVDEVEFAPLYDGPFDSRILNAYSLPQNLIARATTVKALYDAAIRRLMAQHSIETEFEVWSTFVLKHNKEIRDFVLQEEFGRILDALKERFQKLCYEEAAGGFKDDIQILEEKEARAALQETGRSFKNLGPFVAAMYTVTAREMQAAVELTRRTKIVGGRTVPVMKISPKTMPLMSFPWIFPRELGIIAKGTHGHLEGLSVHQQIPRKQHGKERGGGSSAVADPSGENQEDPEGLYTDDGPYPAQSYKSTYFTANLIRIASTGRKLLFATNPHEGKAKSVEPIHLPTVEPLTSPDPKEHEYRDPDYIRSVLSSSGKTTDELVIRSASASIASCSTRATPAPEDEQQRVSLPIPPPMNWSRTGTPYDDVPLVPAEEDDDDDLPLVAAEEESEVDTRHILGRSSRMEHEEPVPEKSEEGKVGIDNAVDENKVKNVVLNEDDNEEEVVLPTKKGKTSWDMLKRFA